MLNKLLPFATLAALGTAAAVAPGAAATARPSVSAYRADLRPVPHDPSADAGSNARGTAVVVERDGQARVTVVARGLSPNLPHAMHIHGVVQARNECPSRALDANHDGLIDTLEGLPAYGPIDVSLTTHGATGGNLLPDGLDLSRFPVASQAGTLTYQRTITIPADVARSLGSLHVVIHGADLDGDHAYDGRLSTLSDLVHAPVPLEAELPVACGALTGR